jgi:hypothetical protein
MTDINTTTNINDLPTDPANGGSIGGNINLVTNELSATNLSASGSGSGAGSSSIALDQSTISQIVNSLQQASISGVTNLPSRDIPINTQLLTNDETILPNYVPPPYQKDYINENEEDMGNYYRKEKTENSLDAFYDEVQIPILLAVLYFLFQLPFFKRLIGKYLPFLYQVDGNYNIYGLVFTCIMFGGIYYLLQKTMKQFSKF